MDGNPWLFGEGSELEVWQMAARAVLVFFIALILIRTSAEDHSDSTAPSMLA